MPTLILPGKDVKELLDMPSVLDAVEQTFKDQQQGKTHMPPKAYLVVPDGDFRAMPASVPGGAGLKWVNVHTQNPSQGLPTVMAILIYNDPRTGYPLAIMDATEITAYRTGATSAIASKHLAKKDSSTLGIIGVGHQAYTHILAHTSVFNLKSIKVFDLREAAVERLIDNLPDLPIEMGTLEDVAACDIICTLTPSRKPILPAKLVRSGTHINAVGADGAGKQELELKTIQQAKVIVDDITQSTKAGEINVPISHGDYHEEDIHATLGEIICVEKTGRTSKKDITVFDSTGIAIEDISIAKLVYAKANQDGGFRCLNLLEK